MAIGSIMQAKQEKLLRATGYGRTHKPLVGSSNLPVATVFRVAPPFGVRTSGEGGDARKRRPFFSYTEIVKQTWS